MLSGHDFSRASAGIAEYRAAAGNGVPTVSFDTAKTILMPAYLCEKGVERDYLRFNGMDMSAAETAVVSEPHEGIVAVMAVAAAVAELVFGEFGSGVSFTSPLLDIASGRKRDVNILLTEENAYITVWEKGLRMAEVLPDNSADSLLYYLQVTGRRFKLRRFSVNISGTDAAEAGHVLRRYFPKINILP